MKTLKVEEVYLAGYAKFDDVATRLPYFIEEIYKERRMHSALGYQSPNHFEAQLARQAHHFMARPWSSPKGHSTTLSQLLPFKEWQSPQIAGFAPFFYSWRTSKTNPT